MDSGSQRGMPIWVWGAVLAVVLIVLSRGGPGLGNPALSQYFALQPTPAGLDPGFELPDLQIDGLPPSLQASARELWRKLGLGGSGAPIEPRAQTARLQIEVRELKRVAGGLQVSGSVTNISGADLQVPISAFELRDSAGGSYIAGGGASATLRPGESTPLELTVPLPEGRGLLLVTNLPPDQPAEQKLLVADVP